MITIRDERPADIAAREELLDACFGDERFEKTSERLREGRLPAPGLALVIEADHKLVGTVRLWPVTVANRPALLLGPLAIDPALHGLGLGSKLMRVALNRAAMLGHGAVLLIGDAPYYKRFGFAAEPTRQMRLPGPVERERFLALELKPGALAGARGPVRAAGERDRMPALPALVAANARGPLPARTAA
jgi:predicted N-acetyltransferase YhbS